MKRNTIIVSCAVVVLLGLIIFQINQSKPQGHIPITASSEQTHFTSNYPSSQESSNVPTMTSKITVYVVKAYKGHIGVFINNGSIPYEEVEVDVSSLPEPDQVLLSKGISVTDESKLNSVLEDYQS